MDLLSRIIEKEYKLSEIEFFEKKIIMTKNYGPSEETIKELISCTSIENQYFYDEINDSFYKNWNFHFLYKYI